MFENVGGGEILLILLVILIFFGPKKIPELAQSLGKGLRKFNDAKAGIESQVKDAIKEPLEAITGAKQGFESSLRAAAAPLQTELKLPQNLTPQPLPPQAPVLPLPPETQARGNSEIPSREA
ncbi:MAG TPA: twin-arginine translocase TatA/TatE family subunit [Candidatus Kapabacteria bacterium]|nr:twin-arginine translocase TatA/TatE family subunit [Candidatus Kapabacteria bacterium]